MAQYQSYQELADKIDHEGGIYSMLFGYGLSIDEMPDTELHYRMMRIGPLVKDLQIQVDHFMSLLPAPSGE